MALLEKHGVRITAEQEKRSWLEVLVVGFLPWLLIIGVFVYLGRKMQSQTKGMMGSGGLFGIGRSGARRYERSAADVGFKDVAGQENAKRDLQEVVEYLKDPGHFSSLGAKTPRGQIHQAF